MASRVCDFAICISSRSFFIDHLGGLRVTLNFLRLEPELDQAADGQNLSNGLFILKLPACRVAVVGLDLDRDRPIQPRRDNAGLDLDRVGPE